MAMPRPVTTDVINAILRADSRERVCSRCDDKAGRFELWVVIGNLQDMESTRAVARRYDAVDAGSRIT